MGCSPWGCRESEMTERLHFHFSLSCIGEGNGNPLQCSSLENPRHGGAWWAAVYGAAQGRTRLKRLSSNITIYNFVFVCLCLCNTCIVIAKTTIEDYIFVSSNLQFDSIWDNFYNFIIVYFPLKSPGKVYFCFIFTSLVTLCCLRVNIRITFHK